MYLPAVYIDIRVGVTGGVRCEGTAEVQPGKNLANAGSSLVSIKTRTIVVPGLFARSLTRSYFELDLVVLPIVSWLNCYTSAYKLVVLVSVKGCAVNNDTVRGASRLEMLLEDMRRGWNLTVSRRF